MAYIDNVTNILQIQPDGLPTFVRLSQNENGRNLYFQLAGNEIDIPANATITISGTKPDGTVYSGTGSISDNVILIPEMIQMTAVAGYWDAKVKIISGGNTIATGRIRFVIDADTVDPDSVPSDSELEGLVAEAQQYAETARTEAYGSPLTATTAAGMTDHTRVYVYTGSETGYTAGHWYYWDGTQWTDGGIYNSTAVNTDPTLTLAGVAADAKATGDAIEAARVAIDDTLTNEGEAADAAAVGSEISGLKEDLNQIESLKVNKPTSSPNGTAGQLLRTNGDGTTQWVSQGLPTDDQTAQAVTDWLDEHPEATTTVQDNSLTENKLTESARFYVSGSVYTIDVAKFGGYNDGTHAAETEKAINDAIAYAKQNNYDGVVLPEGLYLILGYDPTKTDSEAYKNAGIVPPSNIKIILSDAATIKVAPNSKPRYNAFYLYNVDNVVITGGSIVGDRPDHDYVTVTSTHEFGVGVRLIGSHNCTIYNTKISDFTGDCISLAAIGWKINDDYNPTSDTNITNCDLSKVRRNGISIVGTNRTTIQGCHVHDIGTTLDGIDGTAPKSGIDIEGWSDSGNIMAEPYETVIINNYFDSNFLDMNMHSGVKVLVDGNYFERINCGYAYQSTISNNIFVGDGTGNAIMSEGVRETFNKNNYIIANNVIDNYEIGIYIRGCDAEISGNLISNCSSFGIATIGKTNFYTTYLSLHDNHITDCTTGVQIFYTGHVSVNNNRICKSTSDAIYIHVYNQSDIDITNNVFDGCTGLFNIPYNADSANKYRILNNRASNCDRSGSTGAIRVNESCDVEIAGNCFDDMACFVIISIATNSSFPVVGKININNNIFKKCRRLIPDTENYRGYAITATSSNSPILHIEGNRFYVDPVTSPIIDVSHADTDFSGIVGNSFYPVDSNVTSNIQMILSRGTGVGLIANNVLNTGRIVSLNTDVLFNNYIKS